MGALPADRRVPATKQTQRPRRALSRLIADCPLRNKPNAFAGRCPGGSPSAGCETNPSGSPGHGFPERAYSAITCSALAPILAIPLRAQTPAAWQSERAWPAPEAARISTPTLSTTIYYTGQCCRVKVIIEIIFNNPLRRVGAARPERVQSPFFARKRGPRKRRQSPFWRSDGRYALKSAARPVDDGPVRVGYGRASKVSHQGHSLGAS